MKITALYAYNEYSEGAKELARALGIKRIKHVGSKFIGSKDKVVLNWGSSAVTAEVAKCQLLNSPHLIGPMSNKLKFFELMSDHDEVNIPEWTTDIHEAAQWWRDGELVVERHKLTGHSGEGIRLSSRQSGVDLNAAPLYTKYLPKKDEYRVHVFRGKAIDVQQKKKRIDFEGEANFKIRNHANGFIYARQELDVPETVLEQSTACAKATGLDFGAVDIIYNQAKNLAVVLEVNTAPGLSGETINVYARAIMEA